MPQSGISCAVRRISLQKNNAGITSVVFFAFISPLRASERSTRCSIWDDRTWDRVPADKIGKSRRREICSQIKAWKMQEYCMYFKFFKPQSCGERAAVSRRRFYLAAQRGNLGLAAATGAGSSEEFTGTTGTSL